MNVDKSVRILEFVTTDEFNNLNEKDKQEYINDFINIKEDEKPISFRNKTKKEIEKFFLSINKKFRQIIQNDLKIKDNFSILKSSTNNKNGSDVIVTTPEKEKYNVELKFGNETLANIGNERMDKIFGTINKFQKLSKKIYTNQREFVDKMLNFQPSNLQQNIILKNLSNQLYEYIDELQKMKITISNEEILNLLSSTGDGNCENIKGLLKYEISFSSIIKKIVYISNNKWHIENIEIPHNKARIRIVISDYKYKIQFLLNWKNSYTYRNIKWKAKLGLGASNWNVWLKDNKTK